MPFALLPTRTQKCSAASLGLRRAQGTVAAMCPAAPGAEQLRDTAGHSIQPALVQRPNWYNTEFKIFTLVRKSEEAGVDFIPTISANRGNKMQNRRLGCATLLSSSDAMALGHRVGL